MRTSLKLFRLSYSCFAIAMFCIIFSAIISTELLLWGWLFFIIQAISGIGGMIKGNKELELMLEELNSLELKYLKNKK